MEDLNFFETYKGEKVFKKRLFLYLIFINLVVLLMVLALINKVKIRTMKREIEELQSILIDRKVNKRLEEIKEKEEEYKEIKIELEKLLSLEANLTKKDIINHQLLEKISTIIPGDIFLTKIEIRDTGIEMVGNSKDLYSIAYTVKALETVEEFYQAFISHITLNGNYYNFVINIRFKEVGETYDDPTYEGE